MLTEIIAVAFARMKMPNVQKIEQKFIAEQINLLFKYPKAREHFLRILVQKVDIYSGHEVTLQEADPATFSLRPEGNVFYFELAKGRRKHKILLGAVNGIVKPADSSQ